MAGAINKRQKGYEGFRVNPQQSSSPQCAISNRLRAGAEPLAMPTSARPNLLLTMCDAVQHYSRIDANLAALPDQGGVSMSKKK